MNKDIIYALEAKYKPGTLNELYKKYVERSITIDTRFRDNYFKTSASDFMMNLPSPLNDVLELDIAQLQIPKAWYTISKTLGNNYFHVNNTPIIIPDGNYDAVSMKLALTNALNTINVTIDISSNNGIGTNKTIFNTATHVNFNLTFDGNSIDYAPLPLKLGWILGFRQGEYKSNKGPIVSEGQFDAYGPRYLYLAIDDFNHNTMADHYSALNSSVINKKIIASYSLLPNNDKPNGQDSNYYSKTETFLRQYTGPVNINRLKIQLLDEYGRILDLNNMDYSFILKFKTLYIR